MFDSMRGSSLREKFGLEDESEPKIEPEPKKEPETPVAAESTEEEEEEEPMEPDQLSLPDFGDMDFGLKLEEPEEEVKEEPKPEPKPEPVPEPPKEKTEYEKMQDMLGGDMPQLDLSKLLFKENQLMSVFTSTKIETKPEEPVEQVEPVEEEKEEPAPQNFGPRPEINNLKPPVLREFGAGDMQDMTFKPKQEIVQPTPRCET